MKNKVIDGFIKKNKDIVIDLEDVEYLINDTSLEAIEKGDKNIPLIQLFDGQVYFINLKEIEDSLFRKGAIDYLDKKS